MYRASIRMLIPPQKQKEAIKILEAAAEEARTEKGCLGSQVFKGTKNKRLIHFEEHWESEEDLNRHLQSDNYRTVLLVIEMAIERPEVRFDKIEISSGMNTIKIARKTE